MQKHFCSIGESGVLTNCHFVVSCVKNNSTTNKHCCFDTKSLSDNILQIRYRPILHKSAVIIITSQRESVTWITWGRSALPPETRSTSYRRSERKDVWTGTPWRNRSAPVHCSAHCRLASTVNCCWKYNVCWSTWTPNFWCMAVFKSATVSYKGYRVYTQNTARLVNWPSPHRPQSVSVRPQKYKDSTTPWDHVHSPFHLNFKLYPIKIHQTKANYVHVKYSHVYSM